MRVVLIIAYNGTDFLGSQAQTSSPNTILGNLQRVLIKLGIDAMPIASGRTDKGVHATKQICHIDLPDFWLNTKKLKRVMNKMLVSSICILDIKEVDKDFHARYSAKKRVYRYIIKDSNSNPFEDNFVTFLPHVDFNKIQKNIQLFTGEHNFSYFMKTGSDTKSSIRVIYKAFAYRYKNYMVLNFEANGFLRGQIRLMVGALLRLDAIEIEKQLQGEKNHKIKPAPSNGLYLSQIKY